VRKNVTKPTHLIDSPPSFKPCTIFAFSFARKHFHPVTKIIKLYLYPDQTKFISKTMLVHELVKLFGMKFRPDKKLGSRKITYLAVFYYIGFIALTGRSGKIKKKPTYRVQ
jgi:hypothetical protein